MALAAEPNGDADVQIQALVPVNKPFRLIPVGLKEAALDSPSFRASAAHYFDQIDVIEKWLDGLVKSANKLAAEASIIENIMNSFLAHAAPPQALSEATVDHDYTLLANRRYGDGAKDFWTRAIDSVRKMPETLIEPINKFRDSDLRPFREARRILEQSQKHFDNLTFRYASQTKTKEPSALREDAFQLHEARKSYLKSSMDFYVLAPQFRMSFDALLVKVFSSQWERMTHLHKTSSDVFDKHGAELQRVQKWSQELAQGEKILKRELLLARKAIEDSAEAAARPSRDLDAYSTSTVPYLAAGTRQNAAAPTDSKSAPAPSSKQGWLFLRTITGKPARTNWVRRWFFVKNGVFGWLVPGIRSGGVEESEKIGVLLCNVRPAFLEERRFCFEVKTKDSTIMLQTETQPDLTEWLSVFEMAKRKALEDPGSVESRPDAGGLSSDAAFAVNPPVAPELAAKRADGQISSFTEDATISLAPSDLDSPAALVARGSFDVAALHRSQTEKEADRHRDHAARIIQKLDLHRKSTATSQLTPGSLQPSGIASLISASHTALQSGSSPQPSVSPGELKSPGLQAAPSASLAPMTLASPPIPTNLSKTAIALAMDHGYDLGKVDGTGGMPSALMSNIWGSFNYGHVSRIERGEVHAPKSKAQSTTGEPERRLSDPPGGPDASVSGSAENRPGEAVPLAPSPPRVTAMHRKTVSDVDVHEGTGDLKKEVLGGPDYPYNYPAHLRAHDANLRLMFPNIPSSDRVVLVFRAAWNPDENQELPGRVFVTASGEMYFYSHHFGFILVAGATLSNATEINVKQGSDFDVFYFHYLETITQDQPSTLTLKVYLDNATLLRRRLDIIAENARYSSSLEELIRKLIKAETEPADREQSSERISQLPSPSRQTTEKRTGLQFDRKFFAGDPSAFADGDEGVKLKLPPQPVHYIPRNVQNLAIEQTFDVSAKGLFHVMFGDRSAIHQMLYRQRRANAVTQFPWIKSDNMFSRKFEYQIDAVDGAQRDKSITIVDTQSIDVATDHLCYVVSDWKTPWHLPHPKDFSMLTKIVITHVAKSKSKLALFTKVNWIQHPALYQRLIERHAMDDLRLDALNLMDLITNQVERLGDCSTKRAIQIFGHIGHHTEAAQITSADPLLLERPHRLIRQTSLMRLILETMYSGGTSALSLLVMLLISLSRGATKVLKTHTVLLALLLASASLQIIGTSDLAIQWYRERSTANFMSRLGVRPNAIMSKAVYLRDVLDISKPDNIAWTVPSNECSDTFRAVLDSSDADSPSPQLSISSLPGSTKSTAIRLHRTRQNMGAYRHDLLVALRMVNRIEHEAVHSEYETWLGNESVKCRQLEGLLAQNRSDGGEKHHAPGADMGNTNLTDWHRAYCSSCHAEKERVTNAHI